MSFCNGGTTCIARSNWGQGSVQFLGVGPPSYVCCVSIALHLLPVTPAAKPHLVPAHEVAVIRNVGIILILCTVIPSMWDSPLIFPCHIFSSIICCLKFIDIDSIHLVGRPWIE